MWIEIIRIAVPVALWITGSSLAISASSGAIGRYGPPGGVVKTDVTLDVSRGAGGGDGNGTAFRTIQGAIDAARPRLHAGKSVTIRIHPGTYYESPRIDAGRWSETARNALLIIEGSGDRSSVVSGLEQSGFSPKGWSRLEGPGNLYSHPWNREYGLNWGPEPDRVGVLPAPALMRRELLVADGRVLLQKELMSYEWVDPDGPRKSLVKENGKWEIRKDGDTLPGRMEPRGVVKEGLGVLDQPWTFCIADHPGLPERLRNKIILRLPDGMTIGAVRAIRVSRVVGPSVLGETARTDREALFLVTGKNNLVIRNLTLRHAGTALYGAGMGLRELRGFRLENVTSSHHYGDGLQLHRARNFRITHCRFDDNGHNGATLSPAVHHGRVESTSFSFNQVRAYAHDYRGATQAGVKTVANANDVAFIRCAALGNPRGGFWTDAFCRNVIYQSCLAMGNGGFGFFLEWSWESGRGDMVRNCVSAFNNVGVRIAEVVRPIVQDNILLMNDVAFEIRNLPTRTPTTKDEIGTIRLAGNEVYIGEKGRAMVIQHGEHLLVTIQCDRNHFVTSSSRAQFHVRGEGSGRYDFDQWKRLLERKGAPAPRGASSTWRVETDLAGEIDILNNRSRVAIKAARFKVPLPVEMMTDAKRRFDLMTGRDSTFADW